MGWTNVSDGIPPLTDDCLYRSDDVLCQDGGGNIFIGYVRYDIDSEQNPLWTHSGRDMYDLDGIVNWISMREVSESIDPNVMPDKMSGQTSVRFEHGLSDRIGPVLGPFEWVQLTYGSLRAKLPDQEEEIDLAFIEDDEWIRNGLVWSDVVIFSASGAQKGGE